MLWWSVQVSMTVLMWTIYIEFEETSIKLSVLLSANYTISEWFSSVLRQWKNYVIFNVLYACLLNKNTGYVLCLRRFLSVNHGNDTKYHFIWSIVHFTLKLTSMHIRHKTYMQVLDAKILIIWCRSILLQIGVIFSKHQLWIYFVDKI